MIDDKHSSLSIIKQCRLLGLHRSGLYYKPCSETLENLTILGLLDEQYFKTPFYGARKLTVWLKNQGFKINRKRVRRLMDLMGWQTLYRRKNTSEPDKQNRLYPYLLKGLRMERPNQVWAMDITYVPMRRGFMYLAAVIDLHTRFVLNWSVSNTMTAEWCAGIVAEALGEYGQPDIFLIPIRAVSSAVNYLPNNCWIGTYRSARTVREGPLIIFLLSGSGDRLSMNTFICMWLRMASSFIRD